MEMCPFCTQDTAFNHQEWCHLHPNNIACAVEDERMETHRRWLSLNEMELPDTSIKQQVKIGTLKAGLKIKDEANEILTKRNTKLEDKVDKLLESQISIEYTNRKLVEHLMDAKAEIKEFRRCLKYYRDDCSGYEPSLSVFHRMITELIGEK